MKPELVRTSKFLSLVLRHQPEVIGLDMDANGWVQVDHLLERLAAEGRAMDLETLREVVSTSDKQRFAFSEDGLSIRANQGHSVEIDLGLAPQVPPDVLMHGTADRNVESILRDGLHAGKRRYVHLSLDEVTATKVGSRHGKPAILEVNAKAMHGAGLIFYCSDNGVWLTESVPAVYLKRRAAS